MKGIHGLMILVAACSGDDGPGAAGDAGGDGVGPGPSGWAQRFGGFGNDESLGLALDTSGNIYLVGTFNGQISFRDGELFQGVGSYVASLTPDGATRWAHELSSSVLVEATAVATGADAVHITGSGAGTLDLGGTPVDAGMWESPFHARYGLDGSHQLSMISAQRLADGNNGHGYGIAAGADGAPWIVGTIGQQNGAQMQFGDKTLTVVGGSEAFVAAFAPDNSVPVARTAGDNATSVVVTGTSVTIAGTFSGTLDLGGVPITSAGSQDFLVASFDLTGAYRWQYATGTTAIESGYAVAVHDQRTYATGIVSGQATVVALDDGGTLAWKRDPVDGIGKALAVDAAGNVYVAGRIDASATVGTTSLTHAGGGDAFVISYTPAGDVRWAVAYGSGGNDSATGIAVDAAGRVFVTGTFERTVDVGGTMLESDQAATTDVFVVRIDPT